jgi:plastocyanin
MRFHGLVFIASAALFGACGGGDKGANTTDTAAATAQPAAGASTGAAPATAAGAPAAVTGAWHEVKMLVDDKGTYKFDPADVSVKQGDGIKFIMVSGGPHNVAFDPADPTVAAAKSQLDANMPGAKTGELSGPFLMNPNEVYEVSFANVKPGKYPYHCTPHLAMGMKGTITVQ